MQIRARAGRPTKSVRDMYSNMGGGLTTQERTIPDRTEISLQTGSPTSAAVDSPLGRRYATKSDTWSIVGVIAVGLLLLFLFHHS